MLPYQSQLTESQRGNGTDTQVRAQMINKCRIKIGRKELYNVRDPPWGMGRKNRN